MDPKTEALLKAAQEALAKLEEHLKGTGPRPNDSGQDPPPGGHQ